jgi:hypothetical protein
MNINEKNQNITYQKYERNLTCKLTICQELAHTYSILTLQDTYIYGHIGAMLVISPCLIF